MENFKKILLLPIRLNYKSYNGMRNKNSQVMYIQ